MTLSCIHLPHISIHLVKGESSANMKWKRSHVFFPIPISVSQEDSGTPSLVFCGSGSLLSSAPLLIFLYSPLLCSSSVYAVFLALIMWPLYMDLLPLEPPRERFDFFPLHWLIFPHSSLFFFSNSVCLSSSCCLRCFCCPLFLLESHPLLTGSIYSFSGFLISLSF